MKQICSDKVTVQELIRQCYRFNLKHFVISPGSRNAPLTITLTNNPDFTCYSIPDERSAAFYALGMAKKSQAPVALVCTSGTAALNYAPAIAEAYYQEIPLIVLSADRPPEWIDQEDGQTIHQPDIYDNYICFSANLPIVNDETERAGLLITEAFNNCLSKKQGPVHINIPFDEPLYNTIEVEIEKKPILKSIVETNNEQQFENLRNIWNASEKVIVLVGTSLPNAELNSTLSQIANNKNVVVIAPSYSNQFDDKFISIPELIFNTISDDVKKYLQPDLLITVGGPVVTKATKLFLRKYKAKQHFDIDFNETRIDTYLQLTEKIFSSPLNAVSYVNERCDKKSIEYLDKFMTYQKLVQKEKDKIIDDFDFCDLNIFKTIFERSKNVDFHFSNSTPVRYSDLFINNACSYFTNRGTSGIDGNTSIASGFAIHTNNKVVLITGDISFGYDSNAFWNNHVPKNLKVIVINNGGGNIFRIINGPEKSGSLPYFETTIQKDTKLHCQSYGIDYLSATNANEFTEQYDLLLASTSCTVLEVITNGAYSASCYKQLFRKLRLK